MRILGFFSAACAATAIVAAHNVAAHCINLILVISLLTYLIIVFFVFCLVRESLFHHKAAVIATQLHSADVSLIMKSMLGFYALPPGFVSILFFILVFVV